MVERAPSPPSVEQLTDLTRPDMNALIGLQRLERPANRLRPSSELQARMEGYVGREEAVLFVARTAINSYNDATGEIIGYIAAEERPVDEPDTLHIEGLFMRPTARGYSLGKMLVGRVLQHAGTRGLASIQVDTFPQGIEGHKLLKSMDFRLGENRLYTRSVAD